MSGIGQKLLTGEGEEGADEVDQRAFMDGSFLTHSAHSMDARATDQLSQDRFHLIVLVVSGENCSRVDLFGDIDEEFISQLPRHFFHILFGSGCHSFCIHRTGNTG